MGGELQHVIPALIILPSAKALPARAPAPKAIDGGDRGRPFVWPPPPSRRKRFRLAPDDNDSERQRVWAEIEARERESRERQRGARAAGELETSEPPAESAPDSPERTRAEIERRELVEWLRIHGAT
jgi:hypothetical protein